MIIGRREDYIEKLRRAIIAWHRQDALLSLAGYGCNYMMSVFRCFLENAGLKPQGFEHSFEDYDDEILEEINELVKRRDKNFKHQLLAHYEKHNPRARAASRQQLTMEF